MESTEARRVEIVIREYAEEFLFLSLRFVFVMVEIFRNPFTECAVRPTHRSILFVILEYHLAHAKALQQPSAKMSLFEGVLPVPTFINQIVRQIKRPTPQ